MLRKASHGASRLVRSAPIGCGAGRELGIDPETAAKYARAQSYVRRCPGPRASKLDAYKSILTRWLERHPYSATQLFQRLCQEEGYTGGLSILKDYVRRCGLRLSSPWRSPRAKRPRSIGA
ncbi:MAG: hypothetical protein M3463_07425, partial [Verrucomicrobiota bacterium]|nr:hypothetical protein [Verrucomicrobiota bacterium]